jgi:hypothetical protein
VANLPRGTKGGSNHQGKAFERDIISPLIQLYEDQSGRPAEAHHKPISGEKTHFEVFCELVYAALGREPANGFYDVVWKARQKLAAEGYRLLK